MPSAQRLTSLGPAWHRAVYGLAAAPLLLFTLMGWEHGAYATFGVAALIGLGLVLWPVRLGAAVLFWPFGAMACLYGWMLVRDLWRLATGGRPSVLLDADDSVVFVVVELALLAAAVLFLYMWRPRLRIPGRGAA